MAGPAVGRGGREDRNGRLDVHPGQSAAHPQPERAFAILKRRKYADVAQAAARLIKDAAQPAVMLQDHRPAACRGEADRAVGK